MEMLITPGSFMEVCFQDLGHASREKGMSNLTLHKHSCSSWTKECKCTLFI